MKTKKQTKKSKRKTKPAKTKDIQTEGSCFPTEKQIKQGWAAEAKSPTFPPIIYPVYPEWSPLSGKQTNASRQRIIDEQLLKKLKSFRELVELLKDILPYWIERKHWSPVCAYDVGNYILKRAAYFRAKDDINVVAIPDNFIGMLDWILDAERALREKDKEKKPTILDIAKAVMADNEITDPRTLTNKINKILKAQGREPTEYGYVRSRKIWGKVRPDK